MKIKTLFKLLLLTLWMNPFVYSQAVIQSTLRDTIRVDQNSNSKADPGDTIRYILTITNTGSSGGTNMQAIIPANALASIVAGSVKTSPVAMDDDYSVTGNVPIMVPAVSGLLANDMDDLVSGLTCTAVTNAATTQSGSITIATNGSFTYTPPAGFTGSDSYVYTLNDGNGVGGTVPATSTGTITFNISNLIWFINNASLAATSDGRLTSPFKSLADFNTSSTNAGNIVYVEHTGTDYTGGIVLANNERLFGEGHTGASNLSGVLPFTLATNSMTLPSINGMPPVITNATGAGVTMGSDNTLRGLNIGDCLGFGIKNTGTSSVGDLVISEVAINNTTGGGFEASNGSGMGMNAVFSNISTSAGVNGINLTGCTGIFTVNGGSISNPTGTGIQISGGTVTLNCAASVTDNTGLAIDIDNHDSNNLTFSGDITTSGSGIRVQNCGGGNKTFSGNITTTAGTAITVNANNGGTFTFSGASKNITSGASNGVNLLTNSGATINFTNGGLVITTTTGTGFNATGGATAVNVTGTGNSINSNSAAALNVANTNIGSGNLNFQSISSGTGVGSAGVGISLNTTGSSGGLVVTGTGSAGTGGTIRNKTGPDGSTTAGIGIYLNSTSNVSLTRMQLNDFDNFAILGSSVTNFTMTNTVINGLNGNNDVTFDEAAVSFSQLLGTSSITNSTISGGREDNLKVVNTSGTLTSLTINGSTFQNNSVAVGNDGIFIQAGGTANMTLNATGNTFAANRGDHIQVDVNGTPVMNAIFSGNMLSGGHAAAMGQGISFTGGTFNSPGTFNYTISNNTITGTINGGAINVNKLSGSGLFQGTISGNTVGNPAVANSGCLNSCDGIVVEAHDSGTHTVAINNNNIYQYNQHGINLEVGEMAGIVALNATVTGNTISNFGASALNGINLNGGIAIGTTNQICADIGGTGAFANSIVNAGNEAGGGFDVRVRQRNSTTVRIPGYGGVNNDNTAVQNYLIARNSGNGTPSANATNNVAGGGGGFVGGAACIQP